jgi:hypothetical protein
MEKSINTVFPNLIHLSNVPLGLPSGTVPRVVGLNVCMGFPSLIRVYVLPV